ncbi:MAG: hypothetical protein ACLQNE_04230 [Thermoguttaceae bacterium]
MQTTSNPYCEWLGFEENSHPGNHYELLRIDPDQRDAEVIARAADALTARIRRIRPGARVEQWQQLLDAVARAKSCLLDPAARSAYDAALRSSSAPAVPSGFPSGMALPPTAHSAGTYPVIDQPPRFSAPDQPSVPQDRDDASAVPSPAAPALTPEPIPGPASNPVVTPHAAGSGVQPVASPTSAVPTVLQDYPMPVFVPAAREYRRAVPQRSGLGKAIVSVMMFALVAVGVLFTFTYLRRQQAAKSLVEERVAEKTTPVRTAQSPGQGVLSKAKLAAAPEGQTQAVSKQPGLGSALRTAAPAAKSPPKRVADQRADVSSPAGKTMLAQADPSAGNQGPGGEKKPGPAADPQKQQALRRDLAASRAAMAARDIPAARTALKSATAHSQTDADAAEVSRVEGLLDNLDEFWKAMNKILAGLGVGQEITVNNTPMIVAATAPGRLTIRSEGQNRDCTPANMPGVLVVTLARESLDPKAVSSKILLGTYLAMDSQGNRAEARRLWEAAAKQGEDVKDLLAELGQSGAVPSAAPASGAKVALPNDPAKLQKAQQAVRTKFREEYDQASSLPGKLALAQKLLEASRAATEMETHFVLLRDSRAMAVAAGKPAVAFEAIDQLDLFFTIDPLEMKTAAVEQAAKAVHLPNASREIADTAMELIAQLGDQRPGASMRLAEVAVAAAKRSNNSMLMRKAKTLSAQVQNLRK